MQSNLLYMWDTLNHIMSEGEIVILLHTLKHYLNLPLT